MPIFTKENIHFNKYMMKMTKQILHSKKWKRMMKEIYIGVEKPIDVSDFTISLKPFGGEPFASLNYGHRNGHIMPEITFDWTLFAFMGRNLVRCSLLHELIHLYLEDNHVETMGKAFKACEKFWGIEKLQLKYSLNWRVNDGEWRED